MASPLMPSALVDRVAPPAERGRARPRRQPRRPPRTSPGGRGDVEPVEVGRPPPGVTTMPTPGLSAEVALVVALGVPARRRLPSMASGSWSSFSPGVPRPRGRSWRRLDAEVGGIGAGSRPAVGGGVDVERRPTRTAGGRCWCRRAGGRRPPGPAPRRRAASVGRTQRALAARPAPGRPTARGAARWAARPRGSGPRRRAPRPRRRVDRGGHGEVVGPCRVEGSSSAARSSSGVGVAVVAVELQAAHDHGVEAPAGRWRDLAGSGGRWCRRARAVAAGVSPENGARAHERLVQHDAERVDVGAAVDRFAARPARGRGT